MKKFKDYYDDCFDQTFRQEPEIFWNDHRVKIDCLIEAFDDLASKIEELEKKLTKS